jgi:ribosome maturation factor RimP
MADVKLVQEIVNQQINSEKEFVVDITISSGNRIMILIDSDEGLTIDRCVKVSRAVEQALDRDSEDFELEVSSPGLSEPFKVKRQYQKNIGRKVEIITTAGQKVTGLLLSADNNGFILETEQMLKLEGKKRKELVVSNAEYNYTDVKSVKIVISFR